MSEATLHRPPAGITPKVFFEDWLPREFARLESLRAEQSLPDPPDVTVNVALEGEGGGSWMVAIADRKLDVRPGAAENPDMGFKLTVEDWRAVLSGDGVEGELVPPQTSTADLLFAATRAHETLQDVRGTIRFEVNGFKGRDWAADVAFGGAEEPRATIAVDGETYIGIRNQTLPAPQAYFSGKIQISGDTNLAMQVGMTLMAKM